jgi:hypothetical protein
VDLEQRGEDQVETPHIYWRLVWPEEGELPELLGEVAQIQVCNAVLRYSKLSQKVWICTLKNVSYARLTVENQLTGQLLNHKSVWVNVNSSVCDEPSPQFRLWFAHIYALFLNHQCL